MRLMIHAPRRVLMNTFLAILLRSTAISTAEFPMPANILKMHLPILKIKRLIVIKACGDLAEFSKEGVQLNILNIYLIR